MRYSVKMSMERNKGKTEERSEKKLSDRLQLQSLCEKENNNGRKGERERSFKR